MARTDTFQNWATDVADSIREKTGKSDKIPASSFDTEIKSITTKEDLDEELITQNEELTEQEALLENIETLLAGKESGGSIINIFMQDKEPTKKDGIWLKTPDYKHSDIAILDSIPEFPAYEWSKLATLRTSVQEPYVAIDKDYIYVFGGSTDSSGSSGTTWTQKIDRSTGTVHNIAALTTNIRTSGGVCITVGTNIYFLGGLNGINNSKTVKYDTLTDTYTLMSDLPASRGRENCRVVAIGTDIYLVGGNPTGTIAASGNIYKYDTLTDTFTSYENVIPSPNGFKENFVAAIGTDIYILGSVKTTRYDVESYKFDTITGTVTQIESLPEAMYGWAFAEGTDIYMYPMSKQEAYKYDTLTGTYEIVDGLKRRLSNMPTGFVIVYDNNMVYEVGGLYTSNYLSNNVYGHPLANPGYENNTVVIIQIDENSYETELVTFNNLAKDSNKLLTKFNDVVYCDTADGIIETIPSYYGDGTQWVKFKN